METLEWRRPSRRLRLARWSEPASVTFSRNALYYLSQEKRGSATFMFEEQARRARRPRSWRRAETPPAAHDLRCLCARRRSDVVVVGGVERVVAGQEDTGFPEHNNSETSCTRYSQARLDALEVAASTCEKPGRKRERRVLYSATRQAAAEPRDASLELR